MLSPLSSAAIIDRTAIVVGNHVILQSDIRRDIRVTAFLNREPLNFSPASLKKAASRLIDQQLIRGQVETGGYPVATQEETDRMLADTRGSYKTEAQYRAALARYGITEGELRDRLMWQLTVLRFIDARFRPAVVVSDQEIEKYYETHKRTLDADLESSRQKISDTLAGDRVNALLDDWLDQTRKDTRIVYLDEELK